MSSSPRITFAVIGVGLIGPRHARTVVQSKEAELVAIVDLMPAGEALAQGLGVAYFKSVADMLQSPNKPEAAIICTPNHTHVPLARELSSGGVHILIEKPFSTDIASGKELVEHLNQCQVKAIVGHHRRFNPYMVTAKSTVSSGSLGRVVAINGIWATYKPMDYFDPPADWRRQSTGGVVLINMIHEVDLLHYLFGPITRVHAEKTISQRGFEAEEGAVLTLRFKSGAVGSFIVSDNLPSPYNFESGTGENPLIPKSGQDFYRIFGTEGSLSVPDMTAWSYTGIKKSWYQELVQQKIPVPDGIPFELQLSHFVRVIRGQETPNCTPEAGLAALVVCQAIKEALEGNKTVDIDTFDF
ncbi:quinate utilization oxidoreductase [Fusarium albosuccineum]|uniref:Quinate utilization oxidoreductase n=1 Tax=Fusarium albosuccineum TaxID=1237068 RepID=A0A8H4PJQ3_9HYPO|nr:quinate utilization oxidoreductase [Fusarium albosuccineum]